MTENRLELEPVTIEDLYDFTDWLEEGTLEGVHDEEGEE